MTTFVAIIFTLLAPLNTLFFVSPVLVRSPEAKVEIQNPAAPGEVKGVENTQGSSFVENLPPAPPIQPVKKDGMGEMAIPTAHASLVLDVDSGTILHYTNGRERRQIASLTKMMTAVLVMEKIGNLNEVAEIDADTIYTEGTRVGCPRSGYCVSQRLKVGEKISVLSLMKAMLMNSANDAAVALAKHVSGTEENFVKLMNEKAKELELKDTNFCTASGLEPEGREAECYSTAYDIARIAAYSMRYEIIWEIFRLPNNTEIYSSDGSCVHNILNTDIVVNEIPGCLGGKTGFTPLAGRSLLVAAEGESKKHRVIAVLLDDPYRWENIKKMVSWAFQSYEWK